MSSLLHEVSEMSQYINLDRLRHKESDKKFNHYIVFPADSSIPQDYSDCMTHVLDMSYSYQNSAKSISICGYDDEELGFILKLCIPNSHIIKPRNLLTVE